MQTNIEAMPNNLLTIDKSAYFEVEKKQLKYSVNEDFESLSGADIVEEEYVN